MSNYPTKFEHTYLEKNQSQKTFRKKGYGNLKLNKQAFPKLVCCCYKPRSNQQMSRDNKSYSQETNSIEYCNNLALVASYYFA